MKNQALFFSKDKSKKLKCRLLQFLFGALKGYILLWLLKFGNIIFESVRLFLSSHPVQKKRSSY